MDRTTSPPETGSLRKRLLLTLTAALLPVLLLSAVSAYVEAQDSVDERRVRLVIRADGAVTGAEQALVQAEALLEMSTDEIVSGNCKPVFDRLSAIIPPLSNVAHFDKAGMSVCSARGEDSFPITDIRWYDQISPETNYLRTDSFYGPISQEWLFAILKPLRTETGELDGVTTLGLKSRELVDLIDVSRLPEDMEIALLDKEGKVYGSERFQTISREWLEMMNGSSSQLFKLTADDGARLDLVIQPLADTDIYAAISRPSPGVWSMIALRPATSFGLPLLVFATALFAAWLAMDELVLKWLSRIRRVARVYGGGHYSFQSADSFANAPQEFASVVKSLDQMALDIQERDTELRGAINTRDAAVKEIHHRVKNNLQIVTSFLNLQGRQLTDPEAKAAITDARNRINALAIVHQTLYQHERLETVNLKPFLSSLIHHLHDGLAMAEQDIRISQDIMDLERPADDAIPVALFAVEAITNAVKCAFGEDGGHIQVSLSQNDSNILLTIADDGRGVDAAAMDPTRKGLGSRLMKAFARQVGGNVSIDSTPGQGYRCELELPLVSRYEKTPS